MKRLNYLIPVLLWSVYLSGQHLQHLDTIYCNETKNVALIFPDKIQSAVTGSPKFIFTYDREKGQTLGLLQGTPEGESNLLVLLENGALFSYLLKYRMHLDSFNFFIPEAKSIGNTQRVTPSSEKSLKNMDSLPSQSARFNRFCRQLTSAKKSRFSCLKTKRHYINLKVDNIVFDQNQFYFVILLENKSSLTYDINFLEVAMQISAEGKTKATQRIKINPIYTYGLPAQILKNELKRVVYVLPKLSLNKHQSLVITLNEKNGSRDLALNIPMKVINNPN